MPRSGPAPRLPRLLLVVGVVVFLVVGWFQTNSLGTWHEELSVYPSVGYRVLASNPHDRALSWPARCGDAHGRRLIWSQSRPRLSLCLDGLSMPIMVESYFSGVFYWPTALAWPLHHGDAFRLRKLVLLTGVLGLLLAYLLVTRLRDEGTAAVVVLVTAVSSPFVYLNSLLVPYEVLPWMFLTVALLLLGPLPLTTNRRRVVLAGLAIGLGVLANVKMVLLVAPLAALVLFRRREWLRALGRRTIGYAGLAAAAACAPMWVFAFVDPQHGFGQQLGWRMATLVKHANPLLVPREVVNELTFGADVGAYLTGHGVTHAALLLPGALATAWAVWHLGRWLIGRAADPLGVLTGAILTSYVFVSLLLYRQTPAANYSPLNTVFGMTLGGALAAAGRKLAASLRGKRAWRPGLLSLGLALPVMLCSTSVLFWRMKVARAMSMSINAVAERRLQDYLLHHVRDNPVIVSTTYNLAGVVESLSRGRLRAIQAHVVLHRCLYRRAGNRNVDSCLEKQFRRILAVTGWKGVDVLAPVGKSMIDEPDSARIIPALERVAAANGFDATEIAHFDSATGAHILTLRRLTPQRHNGTVQR